MPENILPQTPAPPDKKKKEKQRKVSGVAVLMVIILTIIIIVLGERFMFDLNRWFNPAYDQHGSYSYRSSVTTMTKSYTEENYDWYRLGIHTAFNIPVLLGAFLFYFVMYYQKSWNPKRIIVWPYFVFSIWVTLHVVFETFYILIKQYETLGIYIVLIVLAALLTWLAVVVQRKFHEKQERKLLQQ